MCKCFVGWLFLGANFEGLKFSCVHFKKSKTNKNGVFQEHTSRLAAGNKRRGNYQKDAPKWLPRWVLKLYMVTCIHPWRSKRWRGWKRCSWGWKSASKALSESIIRLLISSYLFFNFVPFSSHLPPPRLPLPVLLSPLCRGSRWHLAVPRLQGGQEMQTFLAGRHRDA